MFHSISKFISVIALGTFSSLLAMGAAEAKVLQLTDSRSGIIYGTVDFNNVDSGVVTLFERWCGTDGRKCLDRQFSVPKNYEQFFAINETTVLELSEKVVMEVNPQGSQGRVALKTMTDKGIETIRYFDVLVPRDPFQFERHEIKPDNVIEFKSSASTTPIRILFKDNRTGTSVIKMPDGWCGASASKCGSASFEIDRRLKRWAKLERLEKRDETFGFNDTKFKFAHEDNRLLLVVKKKFEGQGFQEYKFYGQANAQMQPSETKLSKLAPKPNGKTYKISDLKRPMGIYAFLENAKSVKRAKRAGKNSCFGTPTVISKQGQIVFKTFSRNTPDRPYKYLHYLKCASFEGDKPKCEIHQGTPDAPNPIGIMPALKFEPIGDGHFSVCKADETNSCGILFSCIGEHSPMQTSTKLPNGKRLVDAITERWDGAPAVYRYIDNTTISIED